MLYLPPGKSHNRHAALKRTFAKARTWPANGSIPVNPSGIRTIDHPILSVEEVHRSQHPLIGGA
jgi:hypothetical protein